MASAVAAGPASAHQPHDPVGAVAASRGGTILAFLNNVTVPPVGHVAFRSTDGGRGWRSLRGLPNSPTRAARLSPSYDDDGVGYVVKESGLYRTSNHGADWSRIGGGLGTVLDVAMAEDFREGGALCALSVEGRVFVSRDQGETFEPMRDAPRDASSLAVSAEGGGGLLVAVGTRGGRVVVSRGFGPWERVAAGGEPARALKISPGRPGTRTLFAAWGGGSVSAYDESRGWAGTTSALPGGEPTALAVSPSFGRDRVVYAATAAKGVFRSRNGGRDWEALPLPRRPLSPQKVAHFACLEVLETPAGRKLWLGMFEGLWTLDRPDGAWRKIELLPPRVTRSLALSPRFARDGIALAASYGGGLLVSRDGARTWSLLDGGRDARYAGAVALSPGFARDGAAFYGSSRGLRKIALGSPRGRRPRRAPLHFVRALAFSPAYGSDGTILFGSDARGLDPARAASNGVYRSADRGESWELESLGGTPVDALALSPGYPEDGVMFAGGAYAGLHVRSGGAWRRVPELAGATVTSLAVSPGFRRDGTVFAGTGLALYRSTDSGVSWTPLPAPFDSGVAAVALSPDFARDRVLFAGTMNAGLLKSEDGGGTFSLTAAPGALISSLAVSEGFSEDRTVVAGTYDGIYVSRDAGATWTRSVQPDLEPVPPSP